MKFLCKLFLIIGLGIGVKQLIEIKTYGFCLQRILADDIAFQRQWQVEALSSEEQKQLDRLLSQPYYLLGSGSECFAFVSQDQSSVIKFFKLDLLRPVFLRKALFYEDYSAFAGTISNKPCAWSPSLAGMREFRIQRTFNSLKLSYDHLREETGLIYLHLNPTCHLHKTLTLYDASGIAHLVDLDSTKFVVQKRATPVKQHFEMLKKQGNEMEAKQSIDALLAMIIKRCKKGFFDRDFLCRNLGYIGCHVIEIDAGSFNKDKQMKEPWIYKQELFHATRELKKWLQKHDPLLGHYLDQKVMEICNHDLS